MYEYKGKTIVIIGAGLLQVPVINIAKELGMKTVVTDYNKAAPGMALADYPIVMSTRDIDGTMMAITEFAKTHKIDGVITVGTDASMTVAAVANALDLTGIKFEDAVAASNKVIMRQRFRDNHVEIPDFYKCYSMADLQNAADKLGYPFVLKPADNMGARGCMKVENPQSLEIAFNNAKGGSPSGELIAEQYMDGPELSIDALVYDDNIYITGIADRIIEREPYFIEMGHVLPSALPQDQIDAGVDVFIRGIKALGITRGAAKGDIKITSQGAKVGEIAARLSGGFMSAYTFPYATGVNVIHNAIDICLGWPPHDLTPTKNCVSIEQAIVPEPGIVTEIKGIEEALAIEGVKNIFLNVKVGDEVVMPKSNVQKAGNFIVVRENRQAAWQTVKLVHEIIQIKTQKKQPKLTWNEIQENAKIRYNGACKVCPICDGRACRGQVPGMGGIGNGDAFVRNIEDLRNITITTNVIHNVKSVDTGIDFLGEHLSLPVIAAPIAGADINLGNQITELEYNREITFGCKQSGTIALLGDGAPVKLYEMALQAIGECGGHGGLIIKPRSDYNQISARINAAHKVNAKLLGMDIDGLALPQMKTNNQAIEPKSLCQLSEIISAAKVPFIIKGIMSEQDAVNAIEAGAKAIVVSNHGGRIIASHPSAVSVLENIAKAVKGKAVIIYDGGIRSGDDIFKVIALGADLVMIGRPMATAVLGGGRDGVETYLGMLQSQLAKVMLLTGCKSVSDIRREMVNM